MDGSLFLVAQKQRLIRTHMGTIVAQRLTLDDVLAYNIDIDVGDTRTSSIITLREVPRFIVDAFLRIKELNGLRVEGIFRKDGSAARIKSDSLNVHFGIEPIPEHFVVHDVCSWIKKFFREIKTPLFMSHESQLLKLADIFSSTDSRHILFGVIIGLLEVLPSSHFGTLGYLMRCLRKISEHSDVNHMTIENLAIVFAPSIFRNQPALQNPQPYSAKRANSLDTLLSIEKVKRTNDLKILIIQVLIENAERIGVPRDHYKASRRPSDIKRRERLVVKRRIV